MAIYKDESSAKIVFFHDPLVDLKEKKTGAGGYAQISDCFHSYEVYLLCYSRSIAGH